MAFDLAKSVVAPLAEDGAFMPFQTPEGLPVVNDRGEAVGVFLRSRYSTAALRQLRANGNRRLAEASRGISDATVERGEQELNLLLAACTVRFAGVDTLDGKPFTGTPEQVKAFWSDDRFRQIRDKADAWIANEANFMKRSSSAPSNTDDTSSS